MGGPERTAITWQVKPGGNASSGAEWQFRGRPHVSLGRFEQGGTVRRPVTDGQVRHHIGIDAAERRALGKRRVRAVVSARNSWSESGASHSTSSPNQLVRANVPALEGAGYRLRIREPGWFEHRLLKGPDTDINLHVFSTGAAEIDRMLRFRDWLRVSGSDRDLYLRAKRELAQREWRHVQHYADAKTAVIQEIMYRANTAT
ncbi:MAG: GrpB family protein [Streptosporangiaceae bacterium]